MILLTDELRLRLLATELDADGDTLFGPADLGCSELGSFSLEELMSVRLPLGMGIERDIAFETELPLAVWAEAARRAGSIRGAERILASAGHDHGQPP
jgi:hypothetical protein